VTQHLCSVDLLHVNDDSDTNGLTENAGHEIAGHENAGHEFARHDKYGMKIDYITIKVFVLLNF